MIQSRPAKTTMELLLQPTDIIKIILLYVDSLDATSLCLRYTCKFFHDRIPKQLYKPNDLTASYSLDLFKLLVPVCKKDRAMLLAASHHGNLPVIQYLVEERKHYVNSTIISATAKHIRCIEYYLTTQKVNGAITTSCFSVGCLATLRYCIDHGGILSLSHSYDSLNVEDDQCLLECLQFCVERKLDIDRLGILNHCHKMKLIESLKFMLERVSSTDNVRTFIYSLIEYKENDLLRLVLSYRHRGYIKYINIATHLNNVEAVKLLHSDGDKPTPWAFAVAFYTSFDCLKYFHEQNVSWDPKLMNTVTNEFDDVVYKQQHIDYMNEHGYRLELDPDVSIV